MNTNELPGELAALVGVLASRCSLGDIMLVLLSMKETALSRLTISLTALLIMDALAWSLGTLLPLRYLFIHKSLPTVAGIRLLGGGPFEALGNQTLVGAGLVFVVVSLLKILASYWVWQGRMDGAVLWGILTAASAVFWWGFALPFGPLVGVVELVMVVLAWGTLK